jgi:hypothetical protein
MVTPPQQPGTPGSEWVFRSLAAGIGGGSQRREPTVNRMIRHVYGTRNRRPNIKAAAEGLGVSQPTVRRWLKQGLPRRGPNTETLKDQHRGWLDTPAGRASQIPRAVRRQLEGEAPRGVQFHFYGKIRISADARNDIPRSSTFRLSGPEARPVLLAALSGDDAAAQAALEEAAADGFGGPPPDLQIGSMSTEWW